MEFDDTIKKRASIKQFSTQSPKIDLLVECIYAANLAPSPGNLALLRYVIIEDKKRIEEIAKACQQPFIKEAPALIVVCSNKKKSEIMYDKRSNTYVKQHAGAAIEHILLKATDLGLVTCWVGAYVEEMIKDTLDIPEDNDIEAVIPIGYKKRLDKTRQKEKPALDPRLYFEHFKNKHHVEDTTIRREDF